MIWMSTACILVSSSANLTRVPNAQQPGNVAKALGSRDAPVAPNNMLLQG